MHDQEKIEAYIEKNKWSKSLYLLRNIALETEMEEKVKWGIPTYCIDNKNVIGLVGFKNFFGIWFYNGAYINDKKKVLVNAQEGKTKAMRSWKFTSYSALVSEKKEIKKYIEEAIQNQKTGNVLKPDFSKSKKLILSSLLITELKKNKKLEEAFNTFSISKRNEFSEYVASAKREPTKLKRLEKIIPLILEGVSLYAKYK